MSGFRLRRVVHTTVGVLLAAVLVAFPVQSAGATDDPKVNVLVQKAPGSGGAAEKAVESVGGTITYDLSIIDGFAASVPNSRIGYLQSLAAITEVTEDAPVQVHGLLDDALGDTADALKTTTDNTSKTLSDLLVPLAPEAVVEGEATEPVNPEIPQSAVDVPEATDEADQSIFRKIIGADVAETAGATGQGTTVALLDTGVTEVPDLAGRLVDIKTPAGTTKKCMDLSGENHCGDTYGHGTFLAGLIAGSGAQSGGKYKGVAPDSKILSIKISGRDGSASVGKILFAIQWVTAHKNEYGVKVMNLSLGTDSSQSYKYDPLNFAVERAWQSGIAVVVSAGNTGPGARTISKPGDDPFVITTGAIDDLKTVDRGDDILPDFSAKGPTKTDGISKPDLTAPGAHLISLRAPGSAIEQQYPGGGVNSIYRRGSGTSQSAAVVSGAAAVLLSAHPNLTPNQLKYALKNATNSSASNDPNSVGSGLIDLGRAVTNLPVGEANQGIAYARGGGSLKATQGNVKLAVRDGSNLLGVLGDALGIKREDRYDPSGGSWYGTSWYGGSWYGGSWYGGSWYGGSWYGGSWYGGSWYGGSWYGGSWYGGSWYGGSWYGAWD